MKYFRIHTKDIAFATKLPRGLFVSVWKLVERGVMCESEVHEYWENRSWFEKNLPVPSFYEKGNPEKAITWFKENSSGFGMLEKMEFYKRMAEKYGIEIFLTKSEVVPGKLIYEDEYQIAVVDGFHTGNGLRTTKL